MKTEIDKFNPCSDAREFRSKFNTFQEAWEACPRGDWMLWIAKKLNVDIRVLTLAKGKCAETVIHLMKDDRSKKAVQAAIDFGNGLINRNQLNAAAADADDAAADAYTAAAAYAADTATDAAAAAAAAAAADTATDSAAAASYAAAYAAAKTRNQLQTADICRKYLTDVVLKKINNLTKTL